MASEGQATNLTGKEGTKEKFPEALQNDNLERHHAPGQPNVNPKGKGTDPLNKNDNTKVDDRSNDKDNAKKANHERFKMQPDKTENQIHDNQKYPPEPGKPPALNLQPNPLRLDGSFNKPPVGPGMQVRPASNYAGPGVPGPTVRKPDGPVDGFQQPYPSQPRQYQISPNVGYSTPSYSPLPQTQSYTSPQAKGDTSERRPGFPYPNSTGPVPMQRSYPPNQSYTGTMNQGVPRLSQPIVNRPQTYQPSTMQRIMPDAYQKSSNPQPRPVFNTQNLPPTTVSGQYYNPVRTSPMSPSFTPTVGMHSNYGDSTMRMYKPEANISRTPVTTTTVTSPRYVPVSPSPSQNRNIQPDATGEKKVDELKIEQEKKEIEIEKPEEHHKVEVSKEKEDKEQGIVLANVKYFEERDTAKTPLIPTLSSPVKPAPPSRSATFVAGSVVKGESFRKKEYESGIDASSMKHPNLRSILSGKTLDFSPRSRSRNRQDGNKSKGEMINSYPSTPAKTVPGTGKGSSCWATLRTPSRSIFKLTPEEEFLYFFNIARANYHGFYDRTSRIDDATHRKENVPTANGDVHGAKKTPTKLPAPAKRSLSASSPTKTPLKSPGVPKSLPKTPDSPAPPTPLIKKVPMNKIQVGAAPSPNLKAVKSKIGSLANTTHKPGGGNVKIESHKIDFSKAQPRIAAKNDTYAPGGGDKKIQQVKLQWQAKPKVGSLDNAAHKPGGGDKKIESVKLDFKDKAKPKVGSKDNVKHVPGGGAVKNSERPTEWISMRIENQKLEFKAQSKIGSLDNVKHKPGGGDVKIFDDKTYLKQVSCGSSEGRASGTQSYCDLSVISEITSVSAPGTPHHGTAVKIRKSTTLGRIKNDIRKTTEVTVISRSPSVEMKNMAKSPSTHEVKLTYAKVASPKQKKPGLDVGPVEIVNVPACENGAVLKLDETPVEIKSLISSFEQQITNKKGLMFGSEGKNYPKTRPERAPDDPSPTQVNEELAQKFSSVKQELDQVAQGKAGIQENEEKDGMSKFLRNEMAAHEKVGEMWKEIHNIAPDRVGKSDELPPPPPPTPSVNQKPVFQQQQTQNVQLRAQGPRGPFPQATNPPGPRFPNQQMGMQRPQMQSPQRLPFPNQPQTRPPLVSPQRQPYPEQGSGPYPMKLGIVPQRGSSGEILGSLPQQPSTPTSPSSWTNVNQQK